RLERADGRVVDVDVFRHGDAAAEGAHGLLAPADGGFAFRRLADADPGPARFLPGDELVDHARGGGAGAGDEGGADAVGVDGGGCEGGDGVLVEVVGDGDAGSGGAERVKLFAHLAHDDAEVAGVDAHGAQLGSGDPHGGLDAGADVVGVDEQGGVGAHGGHLCAER